MEIKTLKELMNPDSMIGHKELEQTWLKVDEEIEFLDSIMIYLKTPGFLKSNLKLSIDNRIKELKSY